jgi:hypothetical protein
MALTLVPDSESPDEVQLSMPGMPSRIEEGIPVDFGQLRPGQAVYYSGSLPGGPRRGARGVVLRTLRRHAVVDLGNLGIWYVPYYFLSAPSKAA